MISLSRKRSSKLETGHYYLIPGSRTSEENFTPDGSVHMRLIQYMTSGAIKLCTIDEDKIPLMANGHRLRLYHRPLSKESFLRKIANGWPNNDLELIQEERIPTG
jgi:hypothetical protein